MIRYFANNCKFALCRVYLKLVPVKHVHEKGKVWNSISRFVMQFLLFETCFVRFQDMSENFAKGK